MNKYPGSLCPFGSPKLGLWIVWHAPPCWQQCPASLIISYIDIAWSCNWLCFVQIVRLGICETFFAFCEENKFQYNPKWKRLLLIFCNIFFWPISIFLWEKTPWGSSKNIYLWVISTNIYLRVISMNGELALSGDSVTIEIKFSLLSILIFFNLNLISQISKFVLGCSSHSKNLIFLWMIDIKLLGNEESMLVVRRLKKKLFQFLSYLLILLS